MTSRLLSHTRTPSHSDHAYESLGPPTFQLVFGQRILDENTRIVAEAFLQAANAAVGWPNDGILVAR